jgi:hypothetical protein
MADNSSTVFLEIDKLNGLANYYVLGLKIEGIYESGRTMGSYGIRTSTCCSSGNNRWQTNKGDITSQEEIDSM